MNPTSARSLLFAAYPLLVVASMIGSPQGGLFIAAVAGIFALPTLFVGTKAGRIGAIILLFGAVALIASLLGSAEKSIDQYRDRAKRAQEAVPAGADKR